jgi:hypothetical protein
MLLLLGYDFYHVLNDLDNKLRYLATAATRCRPVVGETDTAVERRIGIHQNNPAFSITAFRAARMALLP